MKRLLVKNFLPILFCLVLLQTSVAQTSSRVYQSHTWQNDVLTVRSNDGILTIRPFSEKIIEVSFEKNGFQNPDSSHAVVLNPQKGIAEMSENRNVIMLNTSGLKLQISKENCQIKFSYKYQNTTEEQGGFFENDSLQGFSFRLNNTEKLYGTGERALPLNRRGYRLALYNRPDYGYSAHSELMNYNIPLVMSSEKYMIYFDNAPKGFIDLGKTEPNTLKFETTGGKMTYYLLSGDDFYEIMDAYTDLTGKQPLPPRWVLGNFASRYGYRSESQAREILAKFPEEDFAVDAIVLDHFWYGKGEIKKSVAMGDLDWYAPNWPNGEQMVKDFLDKGVKTVLISQPFILTKSKNFEYLSQNKLLALDDSGKTSIIPDFYFGETGLLDIFKPKAQDWLWQQYKRLTKQGVAGHWGDLGEPEMHPSGMIHVAGKADDVHNIYGHYWAKTIFEGYKKDFPNIRPFILMRGGFAGSQRFGLIPWSGDVSRSWGGLQSQPSLALNMGLAGLAYMHSDLGGFAGDEPNYELYGRWLQYGVFQPVYRPHMQESVPAEPVFYGDSIQNIVRKSINHRYELLPYHYTMAFQNHTEGKPLMRPLFFEEEDNEEVFEINDTYLWGDAFLVAPILNEGQKERKIYLPKGKQWYDYWTKKVYQGGQWITMQTKAETIPVFVKAGAFIPKILAFKNTDQYTSQNLTIEFYLNPEVSEATSMVYEDDGYTRQAFEKGEYELWQLAYQKTDKKQIISIQKGKESYANAPKNREVTFIIFGIDIAPKKVKLNGKKVSKSLYFYDRSNSSLTVKGIWNQEDKLELGW